MDCEQLIKKVKSFQEFTTEELECLENCRGRGFGVISVRIFQNRAVVTLKDEEGKDEMYIVDRDTAVRVEEGRYDGK